MTHRRTDAGMAKGCEYGRDAVAKLDAAIADSAAVPACPVTPAPMTPGITLRTSLTAVRAKTKSIQTGKPPIVASGAMALPTNMGTTSERWTGDVEYLIACVRRLRRQPVLKRIQGKGSS